MPVVIRDARNANALESAKIGGPTLKGGLPAGKVRVQAPNQGPIEVHTIENAGDLVRQLGWTVLSKVVEPKTAVPQVTTAKDPNDGVEAPEKAPDLGELGVLREKLKVLGVTVDSRWGLKTLREKFEEADAAKTAEVVA